MQANPLPRHAAGLAMLATGLAGGLSSPATAGTITVPGDAPTIQIAINLAVNGDEIVVAPGTYFETLDLGGKAITLRSSGGPDVTTIDAFGQFDSAIHAVSGEDAVIEGFTITGGNADGIDDGDPDADDRGGGLFVNGSSVTVIDCVFEDNVAAGFGGAFYSNDGASASFTSCQFIGNQANNGGVAYVNHGLLTFTDCTFVGNDGTNGPGGLRIQTTTIIDGCTFQDNTNANGNGGAIWVTGAGTTLTVVRSHFVVNQCGPTNLGGAVYVAGGTTDIRDTIINGNSAGNTGGAIYAQSGTSLTLVNATVVNNLSSGDVIFGAGSKTVRSSIVWNNSGTIGGGTNNVSWSMVEGGFAGAGNIDPPGGPDFEDVDGPDDLLGNLDDDLHLAAASPAIDAGDASAVIGQYPVDRAGLPRAVDDPDTPDSGLAVLGVAVDMGAYELQPAPVTPSCPTDINGDGVTNVLDLIDVLLAFGSACP